MKRVLLSLLFVSLLARCAFAQAPTPPPVLNDPSQNLLAAKAVISEGYVGSLDGDVRVVLSISNPTQLPISFNLVETLFIQGTEQRGQPLFPDRISVEPLGPGQTTQVHFRYENPEHLQYVSAYVWIDFNANGQRQRTALFVAGPKQAAFIDKWQQTYFPYGHVSGLYAAPGTFLLP